MRPQKEKEDHSYRPRSALFLFLALALIPFCVEATPWKWIAYGDTRTNDNRHREVLQSIMNNTPDHEFIINVGDVVDDGTVTSQWNTWLAACNDVLGGTGQDSIPPRYMSAPGNHDNTETAAGLANWNAYLSGQVGQFGNNGKFFVFDYENARFVIMDSDKSSISGEQYAMLMSAIQNNPKTWLFAIWHHPIFDFGPKQYEDNIHETWGVPLYENGCDIVFTGHAHYYVRTKKLELSGEMNPPLDPDNGTVQIVTGNGGAPLYSVDPNHDGNGYMVESHLRDYGYCELTVDEDTLRLRHIRRDGTVFDKVFYTPNAKPVIAALDDKVTAPTAYRLNQNYPNPFNAMTIISYYLPVNGDVSLVIYDIAGRKVYTLWDGTQSAGMHKHEWKAVDANGHELPSGIYFSRMKADAYSRTMKTTILR